MYMTNKPFSEINVNPDHNMLMGATSSDYIGKSDISKFATSEVFRYLIFLKKKNCGETMSVTKVTKSECAELG